jgi:hypothetical protein
MCNKARTDAVLNPLDITGLMKAVDEAVISLKLRLMSLIQLHRRAVKRLQHIDSYSAFRIRSQPHCGVIDVAVVTRDQRHTLTRHLDEPEPMSLGQLPQLIFVFCRIFF